MVIQQSMARKFSFFYHAFAAIQPANLSDFFNTHACLRQLTELYFVSGGIRPMVELGDRWFQSETYLMKIASIMATIVEIRQGLSEDSSLRLKANLALERLGQLANGEIEVEGNKVMVSECRPWFSE